MSVRLSADVNDKNDTEVGVKLENLPDLVSLHDGSLAHRRSDSVDEPGVVLEDIHNHNLMARARVGWRVRVTVRVRVSVGVMECYVQIQSERNRT